MVSTIRRVVLNPHWMLATLWPLALLTPYLPGLPRPTPGGLPWRQEMVMAFLLCATFALLLRRSWPRRDEALILPRPDALVLVPASLFTLWSAASAFWAALPSKALYQALVWGCYLFFFLLMRHIAARPRLLRASFSTLALVICTLSLACMVNFWTTPAHIPSFFSSMFRYFSGFGEMMGVAIPLFAALALRLRNPRWALACGATATLGWLSTLQTLERAPVVGALAGLLVLAAGSVVMRRCRPRSFVRAVLLMAALAGATAIQFVPSPFATSQLTAAHRLQATTTADANLHVRFLYWGIAWEMLRARPLTGIGANHYENAYADARARFSATRLDQPFIAQNEDMLIRWPHSQYVQTLAELGLIGFMLFLWFCCALVFVFWRALRRASQPMLALGAGGGMFAFALSSGTSVYSFQWLAGGLLFFFAASLISQAAASQETANDSASERRVETINFASPAFIRGVRVCALSVSLLIFYFTGTRAMNAVLEGAAQASADPVRAEHLYRAALRWDAHDATTHYNYGLMLYSARRATEAVPHLRYAAENGFNASLCYAYLVAAQTAIGDYKAAEQTLSQAVKVYPRSVFLRVRHAAALTKLGREQEAGQEYAAALTVNAKAARGWHELIFRGLDAAALAARTDASVALPGELQPEGCVFVILDENKERPRLLNFGLAKQN